MTFVREIAVKLTAVRRNFSKPVFLHCGYKSASHPTVTDDSRPDFSWHSARRFLHVNLAAPTLKGERRHGPYTTGARPPNVHDISSQARELARQQVPKAIIHDSPGAIFTDPSIDALGLFMLADARPEQIRQALANHKHVLAEKPLGADIDTEWKLVKDIEASDRLVAVDLFNRNAWYHKDIQQFIEEGEIGQLAVIRLCHMTPGHMPLEGHDPEGPFHDCGMHYVDVARWYAKSEFKNWHAQGICMWGYRDPWWVQAHGTFENGVVFDITQGFIYGHLAKAQTHNCYVEVIGTKGVARMKHDFAGATVELHGVHKTIRKTAPFNDKRT